MANTKRIGSYDEITFKGIRKGFKKKQDMMNLINYICGENGDTEKKKHIKHIHGYGVPYNDLEKCFEAMYFVKQHYKKSEDKLRKIYHYIVSFPKYIRDIQVVTSASDKIGMELYRRGYQCIYSVHDGTDNLHIHIGVNSTNYYTGGQAHTSKGEFSDMGKHIKKIAFDVLEKNGY